jgi:hypothetical protein
MRGFWPYKFTYLKRITDTKYNEYKIQKKPSQELINQCRNGKILITKSLRKTAGDPL